MKADENHVERSEEGDLLAAGRGLMKGEEEAGPGPMKEGTKEGVTVLLRETGTEKEIEGLPKVEEDGMFVS